MERYETTQDYVDYVVEPSLGDFADEFDVWEIASELFHDDEGEYDDDDAYWQLCEQNAWNAKAWEVIEDNAGGLHIIVRGYDDAVTAAHTHLEFYHPEARTHQAAIDAACEDARLAEGWLDEFEYQGEAARAFAASWDAGCYSAGGWRVVAAGEISHGV